MLIEEQINVFQIAQEVISICLTVKPFVPTYVLLNFSWKTVLKDVRQLAVLDLLNQRQDTAFKDVLEMYRHLVTTKYVTIHA